MGKYLVVVALAALALSASAQYCISGAKPAGVMVGENCVCDIGRFQVGEETANCDGVVQCGVPVSMEPLSIGQVVSDSNLVLEGSNLSFNATFDFAEQRRVVDLYFGNPVCGRNNGEPNGVVNLWQTQCKDNYQIQRDIFELVDCDFIPVIEDNTMYLLGEIHASVEERLPFFGETTFARTVSTMIPVSVALVLSVNVVSDPISVVPQMDIQALVSSVESSSGLVTFSLKTASANGYTFAPNVASLQDAVPAASEATIASAGATACVESPCLQTFTFTVTLNDECSIDGNWVIPFIVECIDENCDPFHTTIAVEFDIGTLCAQVSVGGNLGATMDLLYDTVSVSQVESGLTLAGAITLDSTLELSGATIVELTVTDNNAPGEPEVKTLIEGDEILLPSNFAHGIFANDVLTFTLMVDRGTESGLFVRANGDTLDVTVRAVVEIEYAGGFRRRRTLSGGKMPVARSLEILSSGTDDDSAASTLFASSVALVASAAAGFVAFF